MGLSTGYLTSTASWTQTKSTTGRVDLTQGPDSASSTVTFAVASVNRIYTYAISLAASGTATIDLQALTTLLGETDAWTKVQGLLLTVDSGGGNIKLSQGASNPLTWFWGGTTPTITVQAGGFLALGDGTTATVDATHKTLKLTNLSSSLTATGTLVLFGGT